MLVADDRCLTELGKVVITAGAFAVATDALGVAIATGNVPAWPALLQAVVATSAAYSSAVNDYIACMQRV